MLIYLKIKKFSYDKFYLKLNCVLVSYLMYSRYLVKLYYFIGVVFFLSIGLESER